MSADFLTLLETRFRAASTREIGFSRSAEIAGARAHFSIFGASLAAQIWPPFSHLETEFSGETAWKIRLWDTASTGISPPEIDDSEFRLEWNCSPQRFFYSHDNTLAVYESHVGISWLHRPSKTLWGCFFDAKNWGVYERSRPLPFLLPLLAHERGVGVVHAGLVAHNSRGALVVGKSGSGKTTTSLACLCGDLDFLGEDQVGIAARDGEFSGFSFYNTARVEDAHLARFPELRACAEFENGEKSLLFLGEIFGPTLRASVPIRAILLPKIPDENAPSHTRFSRAKGAEALRATAADSLTLPMGGGRRGFERLAQLARVTPCFHLHLGRDVRQIPLAVREILDLESE